MSKASNEGETRMADRPILFSGPMVRALLEGRKSQTRLLLTAACDNPPALVLDGRVMALDENEKPYRWPRTAAVGERLWVRETWATVNSAAGPGWAYRAGGHFIQPEYDGNDYGAGPSFNYDKYPGSYTMWFSDLLAGAEGHAWVSPIHMPRWASRLTLTVTDVRVQRLQEISEEDARAEGVLWVPGHGEITRDELMADPGYSNFLNCLEGYAVLWNSLNATRAPWASNPWIVALTFGVERMNIDGPQENG